MEKITCEWFLEPKNRRTNKIISLNTAEDNFLRYVVCADGKKRNLWKCPLELVSALWRSRNDLKIKFRIFKRESSNEQIRNCTFLLKNKGKEKKQKQKMQSG